jgi:hypothetical protein
MSSSTCYWMLHCLMSFGEGLTGPERDRVWSLYQALRLQPHGLTRTQAGLTSTLFHSHFEWTLPPFLLHDCLRDLRRGLTRTSTSTRTTWRGPAAGQSLL